VRCAAPRAQEEKRLAAVKEEQEAARAARQVPAPGEHAKLVEFLLSTTSEEMSFELVRCRPLLARGAPPARAPHAHAVVRAAADAAHPRHARAAQTSEFFAHLKGAIRDEKFSSRSRQDRIDELEGLLVVAEQGADKADRSVAQLTAPADRLRKLLTAPDKKAMVRVARAWCPVPPYEPTR
jgi:hypothetical protein